MSIGLLIFLVLVAYGYSKWVDMSFFQCYFFMVVGGVLYEAGKYLLIK